STSTIAWTKAPSLTTAAISLRANIPENSVPPSAIEPTLLDQSRPKSYLRSGELCSRSSVEASDPPSDADTGSGFCESQRSPRAVLLPGSESSRECDPESPQRFDKHRTSRYNTTTFEHATNGDGPEHL